jgi:hypothetical protein
MYLYDIYRYSVFTRDSNVVKTLEALRNTIPEDGQQKFWEFLARKHDLPKMFASLTLQSWGWFFPPETCDLYAISARIFLVVSGVVTGRESPPPCPKCNGRMKFCIDSSSPFGWRYRCISMKQLTRKEKKSKKGGLRKQCRGTLSATSNT